MPISLHRAEPVALLTARLRSAETRPEARPGQQWCRDVHTQAGRGALASGALLAWLICGWPFSGQSAAPEWGNNYYRADPPRGESFSIDPGRQQPQWQTDRFHRRREDAGQADRPAGQYRYAPNWSEHEENEQPLKERERFDHRPGAEVSPLWRNEDLNHRQPPRHNNGYTDPAFSNRYPERRDEVPMVPPYGDFNRERSRWETPFYPQDRERSLREYSVVPPSFFSPYEEERLSAPPLRRRFQPNTYDSGENWWESR
ncbi:MAG: hypothetical protein HQM06_04195 [Magnetococcales bacterium]|nr:hypothetical protein [Magnetococcales bacterium]